MIFLDMLGRKVWLSVSKFFQRFSKPLRHFLTFRTLRESQQHLPLKTGCKFCSGSKSEKTPNLFRRKISNILGLEEQAI
jgi:hypothetical protein